MNKPSDQTRREFLLRTGRVAGLAAITTGLGFALHTSRRFPFEEITDKPLVRDLRIKDIPEQLVVVHGNDPALMTRAAVADIGGFERFVRKGDVVVVKPNIGWDRTPEQAANTNPEIVRAVVTGCLGAGAAKVIVTDISCNDPKRCFMRSGIEQAAREAGARVELPQEAKMKEVNMGGAMLGKQPVYQTYLDADKFINIPIAKHHSLTHATLGMKNLYGIIGGNRSRLHQDIDNSIADLGNFIRPTLTIMDAFRVLRRNGPQGGNLADVEERKTVIASTDMVAIDAYAGETFFGISADRLGHLALAERYALGNIDYRRISFKEVTV